MTATAVIANNTPRLWEGGKRRTVYRGIGWCKGEDGEQRKS